VVEENHADVAAVIVIHHARADVDEVFPGEAGSRRDARVRVLGDGDGQVRLHQALAARGNDCFSRRREKYEKASQKEAVSATDKRVREGFVVLSFARPKKLLFENVRAVA
jgi:hypothetical protein